MSSRQQRSFTSKNVVALKDNGTIYIGILLNEETDLYFLKYPAILDFDALGNWELKFLPLDKIIIRKSQENQPLHPDKLVTAWYVVNKKLHNEFKDPADPNIVDIYLFKDRFGDTSFALPHPLPSGTWSNDGSDGSFSGKHFIEIIWYETGYNLIAIESLLPERVRDLAFKLEYFWDKTQSAISYPLPVFHKQMSLIEKYAGDNENFYEELESLVELFKQASAKGCRYYGWVAKDWLEKNDRPAFHGFFLF